VNGRVCRVSESLESLRVLGTVRGCVESTRSSFSPEKGHEKTPASLSETRVFVVFRLMESRGLSGENG
jgi:hypothetical protein